MRICNLHGKYLPEEIAFYAAATRREPTEPLAVGSVWESAILFTDLTSYESPTKEHLRLSYSSQRVRHLECPQSHPSKLHPLLVPMSDKRDTTKLLLGLRTFIIAVAQG